MSSPTMFQVVSANDKAEILALIQGRQAGPRNEKAIDLLSRDLTIAMRGDSAVCQGVMRVAARKDAGRPEEFWMRETMRLERKPEGWRIVCEQRSAPLSIDGSVPDAWIAGSRLRVDWARHGTALEAGC